MPTYTYTIDNRDYTSNEPLTESELTELSSPEEKPSKVAEAVRRGLTGGVSNIAGLLGFIGAGLQGPTAKEHKGFTYTKEEVEKPLMGMLGSTGVKPETRMQQIGMAGIEAAVDPVSYLLPSSNIAKVLGVAGRPVENYLFGAGGEAGGITGEIAGRKLGDETGAQVGRVVGAITGGMGTGIVAGQIPRAGIALKPAAAKVKTLIDKVRGLQPMEEAEAIAQKHIDNIFVAAATADPNFAKTFEDALVAQAKTGVPMPISSMLADNPVINSYISHLASRDPAFRTEYFAQFENAKKQLGDKAVRLFGQPEEAGKILTESAKGKAEQFAAASKAATRKIGEVEGQAVSIGRGIEEINPAEFGSRVIKITDNAEMAARAKTTPEYTRAFDIAKEKGVTLPKEAVEDIYDTVVTGRNADIFATFPTIYNRVKSVFAPKLGPSQQITEYGILPLEQSKTFKQASIEDLDSLKREINLQLRKAKTDSHIRVLEDLKGKLNEKIDSLDPAFVEQYRRADQLYLKNVGLPFNAETIRSIERAKFDENIVPLLTKNKSTVSQFISVTGEDGKKLVEDALVSSLAKKAVGDDGIINVSKAKGWLAAHRETLSLMPDVRERVTKMAQSTNDLLNRRNIIEKQLEDATKARILGKEGVDVQSVVNNLYTSPQYRARFMSQYGNDKDAMNATRSFMLDDIIKSQNPLEVLNDRTRKATYDQVFGKGYSDIIKNIALVSDRITKDPSAVAINLKDVTADIITKLVGTSVPQFTSLFGTNPVVSKRLAVVIVVNRFFNKKAGEIVERDMKRLLLDREAGARISHAISQAQTKDGIHALNSFASWAKKRGYDFSQMLKEDALAGSTRGYHGMDESQQEQ